MRKITFCLSLVFMLMFSATGLIVASTVEAKTTANKSKRYVGDLYNPRRRYKDEKKEISDATSRCNTAALQKAHVKNLARASQDGKSFDLTPEIVSATEQLTDLQQAYKKYLEGLAFALGAMEEPYCGFGAFGVTAARKSYDKSVERARTRFLEAARQDKVKK